MMIVGDSSYIDRKGNERGKKRTNGGNKLEKYTFQRSGIIRASLEN